MTVEPVTIGPDRPVPAWEKQALRLIVPRLPSWARIRLARLFGRLAPGSRTRRWFLLRISTVAWEATARTDYGLVLPLWDDACLWRWDTKFLTLGFDPVYRGHEGVRRALDNWNQAWAGLSFTVRETLDGGDRLVQRVTFAGRGARGDVPMEMEVSAVVHLAPLIVDWYFFLDHAEALREAGFPPSSDVASTPGGGVNLSTRS